MADGLWVGLESYTDEAKRWLDRVGRHYLQNASPGCVFALAVRESTPGLLAGHAMPCGERLGLCVVGRPVSPKLPQDGSVLEVTRMVLLPGLPYGTASHVLRTAQRYARARDAVSMIAYHDRTRHTGCIYKKSGFRKVGTVDLSPSSARWGSRPGRKSAAYPPTPKRKWEVLL